MLSGRQTARLGRPARTSRGREIAFSALGASVVGAALWLTARNTMPKSNADSSIAEEEPKVAENTMAQEPEHSQRAAIPVNPLSTPEPSADFPETALSPSESAPEESKWTNAEPFREHETGRSNRKHRRGEPEKEELPMVDQDTMTPEAIREGGEVGAVKGDRQKVGEVPTIMDQAEVTPDFAQQIG